MTDKDTGKSNGGFKNSRVHVLISNDELVFRQMNKWRPKQNFFTIFYYLSSSSMISY